MTSDRTGPFYLGIELGGAVIRAGVVNDAGQCRSQVCQPAEADRGPEHGMLRICQAGREAVLAAGLTLKDVFCVGVAAPGPIDLDEQILTNPYHLPGWINVPLARQVGERLGLPAALLKDCHAAALAESWIGAGKGQRSMAYLDVGASIGCGIILDGKLLEGAHSHAAEASHLRISLDEQRRDSNGSFGTLEAYASETAVVDRTLEAMAAGEQTTLGRSASSGSDLTCSAILLAGLADDTLAARIVEETARYLAIGICNLMCLIDPAIVVLRGGMISGETLFLEKIRNYIRTNALPVPAAKTKIVAAELGQEAGFIGAAGCARNKFVTSR